MILGYSALGLSQYSRFNNFLSFIDRPDYEFEKESESYINTTNYNPNSTQTEILPNCSIKMTEELSVFIKELDTIYIVVMYFVCTTLELISLIFFTSFIVKFIKISGGLKYSKVKPDRIFFSSFPITFLAIAFSLPCSYISKIHYGACIEYNGFIGNSFDGDKPYILYLHWISFILPLVYFIKFLPKEPIEETWFKVIELIVWLFSFILVICCYLMKFGSLVYYQIPWDSLMIINLLDITWMYCRMPV